MAPVVAIVAADEQLVRPKEAVAFALDLAPDRGERRVVEAPAGREVAGDQVHMVEQAAAVQLHAFHDDVILLRLAELGFHPARRFYLLGRYVLDAAREAPAMAERVFEAPRDAVAVELVGHRAGAALPPPRARAR